jgi:hypothetical protein
MSHPVITVGGMDKALMDQAALALYVMERFATSFDPHRYPAEEAARILDVLAKIGEFGTAKLLLEIAWAPTGEKEFSERLRRWLVCQQH